MSRNVAASLVLCLAACGSGRSENIRELVGDGHLPAVTVGSNESLGVDLVKASADGTTNLLLTVTPNGKLMVERYAMHWPEPYHRQITRGPTESLTLSAEQATDFRKRLSVFRPPQLSRDGPFVLPKDCSFISNGTSKAVVFFQDVHGGSGSFDLQVGCDNSNAKKLAAGLRDAVAALPATRTAASFNW